MHVVLASRARYQERFPEPREEEVAALIDPGEVEEAGGPSVIVGATGPYASRRFSHAVATRIKPSQDPPQRCDEGDHAIYLDVETIEEVAQEVGVPLEAMLARVLLHEVSHLLRGHVGAEDTPIHGWLAEGDAQRDAWHVLTELLAHLEFGTAARWGRAAQVRLARRQPHAYRHFDATSDERVHLVDHDPVPRVWITEPPRAVFRLISRGNVEVPVSGKATTPMPCDFVYLRDGSMLAGPWIVAASGPESRLAHPQDLRAVEGGTVPGVDSPFVWLSLRPLEPLMADSASSFDLTVGRLRSRELEPAQASKLRGLLRRDAREMMEEAATTDRNDHQEGVAELRSAFRDADKSPPPSLNEPYDPFNDWG